MSFLGRVLGGADLRRAIEAEAGGDYPAAARAYAAVGERHKVAEMHLLQSERAASPDGKLDELREAARWSDGDDERCRKVRRRVAAALLGWARQRGVITDGDRAVVAEAAALFVAVGDGAGAGACHELLGAKEAAAQAYQSAGEVDRLEDLLDLEADRRRRGLAVGDAVEEHRMCLRRGDPSGALRALDVAVDAAEPAERAPLQKMREALAARRLSPGPLLLAAERGRLVLAAPPVVIGRGDEATWPLRDGGLSRRHLILRLERGLWLVEDLGSKNGTALNGTRLAGVLPLPAAGELGVGDALRLTFSTAGEVLHLAIAQGLDRGLRLVASAGPIPIAISSGADPLLEARFVEGRARLRSLGKALFLNGSSVSHDIELLRGDVLEIGGQRWEIPA